MVNFKAIASTFLTAAFYLVLSVSGAAEQSSELGNEQYADTDSFDTMSLTQTEYENLISDKLISAAVNSYESGSVSRLSAFKPTTALSLQTAFHLPRKTSPHSLNTL